MSPALRPLPLFLAALCLAAAAPPSRAAPPWKGLVLWEDGARDHPELSREISLEFAYVRPDELVTGLAPGGTPVVDWSPLERRLDAMARRGHQAVLRFRYEYPGDTAGGVPGATAVPACVKALPGYRETFAPDPGGDGPTWYADWSHPGLEAFTLRFFEAFAERFDADPRVAFLEAGFGHWGEWHVSGTPLRLGVNFPSLPFQRTFLRRLSEWFRETPWLISVDAAERVRSPAAEPDMAALPFGLFDDSFMHRRHDVSQGGGYNERCWRAFGPDRWRRAPAGGEISYFEPGDQRLFLDPRGLHGSTFEEAASRWHVTFMIANDATEGPFATPERFRQASDACGYRLRLVSFDASPAEVRLRFANDGVAPLYHDLRPALGDAVSPVSLRGLAPGETRECVLRPAPPRPSPEALRWVSPKLLPGVPLRIAPPEPRPGESPLPKKGLETAAPEV